MAHEGPILFKDELVTLHRENYQKDSRKLSLQYVCVKGKQVVEKWGSEVEIKNVNPKDIMELHQATGEALAQTVDDKEEKIPGWNKK